jgi:beta-lactamase regulating signal transducer with metallopeptidase domain/thioredoxin-like negative regulator of GroEL
MTDALWQLGGWTMIHFLWLGTAVTLLGGALRFACRRASPGVRYATSLMTFVALAATPITIAAYLVVDVDSAPLLQPRALPGGSQTVERAPTSTPGQSPRLQPAPPRVIDLKVTDVEPAPSQMTNHLDNVPASPHLYGGGLQAASFVAKLPWLWLIGAPITFALLASGLIGSERLRRSSTLLTDAHVAAACERLRQAMRVTRRVSIAVCDRIAQPVLIGILRPLILLPASALSGWTPDELEMVLLHELAHVRRWDNLVNLLQRIVESALFFHPAVWLVSRQVRRDREECCDAIVVARIDRPHDYAALLVAIATSRSRLSAQPSLAAASAMADHPLTTRIRRILKLEDEPMGISRRTIALTLALPLLLVAATVYTAAADEDDNPPSLKRGARGGITASDAPPTKEEAHQPVVPAASPKVGGEGIAAEFPADTDPDVIRKAQEELERSGKEVTLEINADGRKRLVYVTAPPQTSVGERNTPSDLKADLPRLTAEVKRLEDQIAKTNEDLVNIEVFKQLALQSARSPAAIESMVRSEIKQDAKIGEYEKAIATLEQAISNEESAIEASKGTATELNQTELSRLTTQHRQRVLDLGQYRRDREKSIREQIAKMPNEAYRAAIVEYKIRFQAATANLKKYQEELSEANRKLAELTSASSANQAAFPSLEDQKIADRAYKLLGIDFEPVNADELARIKELGYDGGLRIAGLSQMQAQFVGLSEGDVLLGLHVWPTTDLNTLDAILSREDLGQLSPLKFRVARGGQGTFGDTKRIVVTGRINVKQDAFDAREPVDAGEQPVPTEVMLKPQPAPTAKESVDDVILNAEHLAQKNGKFVLVYFYSPSSAPCDAFDAQVFKAPRTRAAVDRDYVVARINVDKSPALAARYGINSIPAAAIIGPHATTSFPCVNRKDFLQKLEHFRKVFSQPAANPLAPGDEVKLRVAGAFPEWPLDDVFRIEEEGTLALGPAYGRVAIAGQTVAEAEKTLLSQLSKILTDVEVQLTLHQRAANAPLGDGKAVYLYDGKPFDEWRTFWQRELNSERRIEAIEALVAFARAGHGREAVEAIFDVAGEYDFKYIGHTPEGKLQERVTQLLTLGSDSRIPAADWLPVLMDRLAKDPKKWRQLAEWLVGGFGLGPDTRLDPTTRKLLLEMARDPKLAPNAFVLATLYKHSPQGKDDPELQPLIKTALTGEDVENALYVLSSLGFGSLDTWPEQMDFLFHEDNAVRRRARSILGNTRLQTRRLVSDRLTAILDDPQRSDDHDDAIRAMGVLSRNVEGGFHGPDQHWPNEEAKKRFRERFARIVREGRPPGLVAPALVAMGIDSVEKVEHYLKSIDATGEVDYKEHVEQARDKIEAEAEQIDDRPKPVPQSDERDMGGSGGRGGGMF